MNSSYVTLQLNNKPFFVKCVVNDDMCQMALFTVLKYNTQFFFFLHEWFKFANSNTATQVCTRH